MSKGEYFVGDWENDLVLPKRREHVVFQAIDIIQFSACFEDLFPPHFEHLYGIH